MSMENLSSKSLRIGNFVKAITTNNEFDIVKEIGFSDDERGYYLRLENINHGVWIDGKRCGGLTSQNSEIHDKSRKINLNFKSSHLK